MTPDKNFTKKKRDLRKQAEEVLQQKPEKHQEFPASKDDLRQLNEELRIHQIELELQNEELRNIQVELQKSRDNYFELFDLAPIGYLTLNPKGLIVEANLTCTELLGVERKRLLNQAFFRFVTHDHQDLFYHHYQQCLKTNLKQTCEIQLQKKDGTHFWASLVSVSLKDEMGHFKQCQIAIDNITGKKQAEEVLKRSKDELEKSVEARTKELKTSQTRYQNLLESSPDAMVVIDQSMNIILVNAETEHLFGYSRDELIGNALTILIPERFHDRHAHHIVDYFAHPTIRFMGKGLELYGANKKGHEFPLDIRLSPLKTETGIIVTAMIRDTTLRKQLEDSLRQSRSYYKELLEAVTSYIYTVQVEEGRAVSTIHHEGCLAVTGYTSQEYEANPFLWFQITHPEDQARVTEHAAKLLKGEGVIPIEHRLLHKDGSVRWIQNTPVVHRNKYVHSYDGIITDITRRKEAEVEIKASLKEKEVLLQEIHHRVKNNLSIVSSFLHLQMDNIKDEHLLYLFQQTEDRVYAMALIHEKLYQSDNLANLNAKEFIQTLVGHLVSSYPFESRFIDLKLDVQEVWLTIDQAIPCGLILNELMTNALKHAFLPEQSGTIEILLETIDNQYQFIFRDNGKGVPRGIDFQAAESLGLKLIDALSKQIEGTVTWKTQKGTAFTMTFPIPPPPPNNRSRKSD